MVDEHGRPVWGDQLMILFSRAILAERPGRTILGEVKCSQTLYDDIAKHGGRPSCGRPGHSLIKKKMKEEHALLAGEMSGHLFFADRYFGYDDAIYASVRLAEILAESGKHARRAARRRAEDVLHAGDPRGGPDAIKFQSSRR